MRRITRFIRLSVVAGVAAGVLLSAAAKEIVVPSSYDESNDTWVGDVVALTNALKNLAQNDVITLSKGVYSIAFMTNSPMYGTSADSGYGLALLFVNQKNVTIRGESGDPEDVVIDATGSDCRAIMNNSTGTKFLDLTVKGGSAGSKCAPYNQRRGGGLMFASSGVVSNCIFTANYAARGGGAISPQNNVTSGTVMDSLFYGNSAGANCGGAIRNCSLVSGCTIVSNKAFTANNKKHGGGGVAYCSTVTNCIITYNYAEGSGGGLYQCKEVFDSTVAHNVAVEYVQFENGGAGGAYGGRFYNCTFKDNYAGSISVGAYMEGCVIEDGGADCLTNINCVIRNLHNSNVHVWAKGNVHYPDGKMIGTRYAIAHVDLIRNCVITNCVWAYDNGSNPNCAFFRTVRRMENCTIADNDYAYFGYELGTVFNTAIVGNWSSWKKAAGDVSMYDSKNFVFSNCVWNVQGTRSNSSRVEPYVDGDCIVLGANVKPKFLNEGEHPLTPKLSSPLVGAGMVMPWMTDAADFAGNPRLRDGKVDIGAYQCWLDPDGFIFKIR